MPLLAWDDKFNLGIPAIDTQHKKLFQIYAQINSVCEKSTSFSMMADKSHRIDLLRVLINLRRYFLFHFCLEEELMCRSGYSDYIQHIKQHNSFIMKIIDFQNELSKGDLFVCKKWLDFISGWIKNHTTKFDALYVRDVKALFETNEGVKLDIT